MSDLTEFLLARIADLEAVAREARGPGQPIYAEKGPAGVAALRHVFRNDPVRVLARCAADRRIVELHTGDHECVGIKYGKPESVYVHPDFAFRHDPTLCLLALPYADHESYDESWRP